MIKVHLHGILDVYPQEIELSVSTAQEAAEAVMQHLNRTHPELFKDKLYFQILGFDNPESLKLPLEVKELHFMPAFNAGKGGFFQVVFGAVLVVGGVLLAPFSGGISTALIGVGLGIAAGGILQVLSPFPQIDTSPEDTNPEASKYLSGTGNTTKIGTKIALAWGTFPIYGQLLSVNIQSKDVAVGTYTGTSVDVYDEDYRYGYASGSSVNVFR